MEEIQFRIAGRHKSILDRPVSEKITFYFFPVIEICVNCVPKRTQDAAPAGMRISFCCCSLDAAG
jgi:hypothetical protein